MKAVDPDDLKIYAEPTVYQGFCVFAENIKTGAKVALEKMHAGHDKAIRAAENYEHKVRTGQLFIRI